MRRSKIPESTKTYALFNQCWASVVDGGLTSGICVVFAGIELVGTTTVCVASGLSCSDTGISDIMFG